MLYKSNENLDTRISIKKNILVFTGMILIILSLMVLKNDLVSVSDGWEFRSAIVTLIFIAFYTYVWIYMGFEIISPKSFILLSLILFHVSNIIVIGLNLAEYNKYLMIYRYGEQYGCIATWYANLVIMMYVIGLIVFDNGKKIYLKDRISDNELMKSRIIGKILFAISVLPTIYSNLRQIIAKAEGGYQAAMIADTSFYGIPLGLFTKLLLPSILLLMSGYRNDKKKCKTIMIITILYYSIFMFFTGRKGNTIQIIVPLIFMYYCLFKPQIKFRQFIYSYILVYLVTIVTKSRDFSIDNGFWEYVNKLIINANPITDLMIEMGGTVKAIIQVMMAVPQTGDFQLGLTYPSGILYSILYDGLSIPVNFLEKYAVFAEYLSLPERGSYINSTVRSMGGSCIAEWYWNFGWLAIPLAIIASWLVLTYEKKIRLNHHNPTKLALQVSFLYFIMRYTRGYITDMIWEPVFIAIIVTICYKFITKKSRSATDVSKYNSTNVQC